MVIRLDLVMKAIMLLSPQMGPILFHGTGREELPQFWILIQEELLLNSSHLMIVSNAVVSPLMENLWLVVLVA